MKRYSLPTHTKYVFGFGGVIVLGSVVLCSDVLGTASVITNVN